MTKYNLNMKGWFKDSWRHVLAAKGVKTGRKSYRVLVKTRFGDYISNKKFNDKVAAEQAIMNSKKADKDLSNPGLKSTNKLLPSEFQMNNKYRVIYQSPKEPIGAENLYEIRPVHHKPGRKALLMQELDYWQSMKGLAEKDEALDKSDINEKIDQLQNKIKRITGRPPTGVVRGETKTELIEGVIDRYDKTSTKRPDFVKELEIVAAIQKKPEHKQAIREELSELQRLENVKRSRMDQAYKRSIPRIADLAEEEAAEEEEKPLTLEVLRLKQGRRPKYLAKKEYDLDEEKHKEYEKRIKYGLDPFLDDDFGTSNIVKEKKGVALIHHRDSASPASEAPDVWEVRDKNKKSLWKSGTTYMGEYAFQGVGPELVSADLRSEAKKKFENIVKKRKYDVKKPEAYLSIWEGDKFIHGPRILEPKKFKAMYTESPPWITKRKRQIVNYKEISHIPKVSGTKVIVGTLKEGVSIRYGKKGQLSKKGDLAIQSFEKPR